MRHGRPPGYPDFSVIVRTLNSNGLAQREIARRLHVSVATVCRWRAADTQPSIVCGCQLLELAGIERPDVPGIRQMHHPPVFDVPRLIHVLEARGLSRTDIARTLQVSPSIVCRWVSQERMPGLRNGLALLELAGVDRSGVPGIRQGRYLKPSDAQSDHRVSLTVL